MLILGHAGITALVASMLFLPALAAIFGALLPDIIDKGLFLIGWFPCTRFLAHTIFFFPIAGLATYAITRNKKVAVAVSLGVIFHLIEDLNSDIPLFYPFKQYSFIDTCAFGIQLTPYIVISEIIGGLLLIYIFGFSKRFLNFRSKFWKYFRRRFSE
ncbi:MAG: metal-dependent hydrolase [Candidatus Aenigmarchaeota archaeon]|nr:metal-dependent hydrolase [Candidatus Aenigmarchaeota archaeon]